MELEDWIMQDIHCVSALVKLFFREIPSPLVSEEAFDMLKEAGNINGLNSDSRAALGYFRKALLKLKKLDYW